MSIDLQQYVPCLRWKQGEYQALLRLSIDIKDVLIPLIEVSEIGYDFESQTENKTVDKHLFTFAKRVRDKWGTRPCFVDMHLIEASQRMADGVHPFAFVFDDLRIKAVPAIPVVRLEQDIACQNAIESILAQDQRGICLRINIVDVVKPDTTNEVDNLLRRYHQEVENCDLILDLGAPNFNPIDGFAGVLHTIIANLPYREKWRSFTILGTAFPSSMGDIRQGISMQHRSEWRLYKFLFNNLRSSKLRGPVFGDYGINHPSVLTLDMRIIKPSATVRYTIDDNWLIAKGSNVRDNGLGQYRQLCQHIINSKHFYGPAYSSADKYIYDCANGEASTGSLTTWRYVGTNHHLTKVARDVANLSGS